MRERRRRPSLRTSLIATAIAFTAGGVVLFRTAPEPERIAAVGASAAMRKVSTLRVAAAPVRLETDVASVLEPRRSVQIFTETRGSVIDVGAEKLDRIEAGALLVKIDPLLARVAVERAEAAVTRAESQLELARSNLERRRNLQERGVASDAMLDDAVHAERVGAALLREARAERTRARDDLAKKTIRAPFSGVLRTFSVEVGEYVNEGQQLGELLDLESARATLGLSDREVVAVRSGEKVEVRVEAYPNEVFEGTILRVGAASDIATGKFPVEVEVPNADGRLLPGMVARVGLELGAPVDRTVIPRDASVDEFGLRFVWLIEPRDGGFVARRQRVSVRPLPFRPGELEVLSGLTEGDVIAVSGIRELRDGELVRRETATP